MKYYVPDNIACEVHEREIDGCRVSGLPLAQQVAIINAYDTYDCFGDDSLTQISTYIGYSESSTVGILKVNTDRDHWYAIVFSELDPDLAKSEAANVLAGWR